MALAVSMLAVACTDEVPTVPDGGMIPIQAETLEILLPFSEFARDFQVFGGFSTVAQLATSFAAREHEGELDARALTRFGQFPGVIQVVPPDEENTVSDSVFTPIGGRLVVRIDTVAYRPPDEIELEAGNPLSAWHLESANWEFAVDTLGNRVAWEEPGGGPVRELALATWRPEEDGDSVVFAVDSATATDWVEGDAEARTIRIGARTPGALVRITSMRMDADVRPSVNADTVVAISAEPTASTFLFTPDPGVDPGEIRIGGVPSRRTFFRFQLPDRVDPGTAICEVVECPVELTADRLMFAGLVLQTKVVEPAAFQPADTLRMDVRPVLAPERLPRSPLGSSVQVSPRALSPEGFRTGGETRVELPMTVFVQNLLRDPGDDEDPPPSTVALLSPVEPTGLSFAALVGPGQEGEPFLRLILTLSEGVSLP
jgi:hypothetical protein